MAMAYPEEEDLLDQEVELLEEAAALLQTMTSSSSSSSEEEEVEEQDDQDKKKKKKRRRQQRSCWVKEWLTKKNQSHYRQLLPDLLASDHKAYKNFLRIEYELFKEIEERVGPSIEKQITKMRAPVPVGERLAITLRFMATGESYKSLSFAFKVASNTISTIIPPTCKAIIEEYVGEVLSCPSSPQEWQQVADGFAKTWNWHNCMGALDGKHIAMKKPAHQGSFFYNYKGFHSIVLMALVDSGHKFLFVDIGSNGSCSDGGVFKATDLYQKLEKGTLGLPEPTPLPDDTEPVPYHIIGDEAFALNTWMMKPYPSRGITRANRIFNYRLSRARRIVENAFGILVQRWRCLLSTLQLCPEHAELVAMACCVMHNLILTRYPRADRDADREDPDNHQVVMGAWRREIGNQWLLGLEGGMDNRPSRDAQNMRTLLRAYYNTVGAVHWQERLTFHKYQKRDNTEEVEQEEQMEEEEEEQQQQED